MIRSRRSARIAALLAVIASQAGPPAAMADEDNPAVTCHSDRVDGVDQDVCIGNPGQVMDAGPEGRFHGDPELRIGVGLWPGF